MVVLSVHSVNTLLGYVRLSWPLNLPAISSGTLAVLKAYGNMLVLVARGLLTAAGVSLVEELLFRSWLVEEITVDYGYYQAILLSAIAFSLIHRYVLCNSKSRMCEFKFTNLLSLLDSLLNI